MRIIDYKTEHITSELITPFRTALRETIATNSIGLTIYTDDEWVGFGEAAGVTAVTGETNDTIICALNGSRYRRAG